MGEEWRASEFAQQVAQAKVAKDFARLKALLVEVAESNYRFRSRWHVPRAVPVTYEECARARAAGGRCPQLSISMWSTADALLHYSADRQRVVCGLNFANGVTPGGGYKSGSTAQEEDLCRRMPTLYSSLHQASRDGLYPFGPPTCTSADRPEKYSDVLYTPEVVLARAGEEDGFALLPRGQQAVVSLVAAAAPNTRFGHDVAEEELIYRTLLTIFVAPRLIQPDVNTLVLGAWGCGAFGGDPQMVAELFVRALVQDNLGQPYREIHFAIPRTSPKDDNHHVFCEVFRKRGLALHCDGPCMQ